MTIIYFVRHAQPDFSYKLEGGESLGEVAKRNVDALVQIIRKYPDSNIAVGTHGTAMSTIIHHFTKDFGFEGFLSIAEKMPHVVELSFNGEKFEGMEEIDVDASVSTG